MVTNTKIHLKFKKEEKQQIFHLYFSHNCNGYKHIRK